MSDSEFADKDTKPLNPEDAVNVISAHRMVSGDTCPGGRIQINQRNIVYGMATGWCVACGEEVMQGPKGWIARLELR